MHKISEPVELLIIDDDFQAIDHLKSNWDQNKHKTNILHKENTEKAWCFLTSNEATHSPHKPNLILLNVEIENELGKQLLIKIKQHPQLKDIPIIVFSNTASKELITFAYQNNANSFITKPTEPENYKQLTLAIQDYWLSIVWFPRN